MRPHLRLSSTSNGGKFNPMGETLQGLKSRLESAHGAIGLIGFPYDAASSFLRGPSSAPPVIRAALFSDITHLWSESGVDLGAGHLVEAGDITLSESTKILEDISGAIRLLLDRNFRPLSLGGDHSVTYPIVSAMREVYPRLSIVQIDAHPDLYDEFEGSRTSHACPFARIMEAGLADRLVQIGIRSINGHQREQAKRFGVEMIEMRNWRDEVELKIDGPVYISFDMDAIDPAFAPGVSHQEPGGLATRQALNLLQRLEVNLVGADVVEYNPFRDLGNTTAMLAAKLVKELAVKMLANPGQHAQ
jgi:arginase